MEELVAILLLWYLSGTVIAFIVAFVVKRNLDDALLWAFTWPLIFFPKKT